MSRALDHGSDLEIGQIWKENGNVWLLLCRAESESEMQYYSWPGWRTLDLETGELSFVLASWLLEGERIA